MSVFLHVVSPNSADRPLTKRCSNLSTCSLGKLSQELHKLQTYPRTIVGAGAPGKRRSLSDAEVFASFGEQFNRNWDDLQPHECYSSFSPMQKIAMHVDSVCLPDLPDRVTH